jgi:hypothetical protein
VCEVADEEAVGFRALNLLFGPLGVRGFPQPESAHPKWGDFGRALESSGLNGSAMKCTIIANWGTGPFQSGKNHVTMTEAAENLMRLVSDEWLSACSDRVAFDQGVLQCDLTADSWMESSCISRRQKFATFQS